VFWHAVNQKSSAKSSLALGARCTETPKQQPQQQHQQKKKQHKTTTIRVDSAHKKFKVSETQLKLFFTLVTKCKRAEDTEREGNNTKSG